MMIVFKDSNTEIKFDCYRFHTLVVENKPLLRNITFSFYNQIPEDYFVFSDNYEPFEFCKKGIYISNVIGFDMNNKKLTSKINTILERLLTNELCGEFLDIKSKLLILAEKLVRESDFIVDCDYDISPHDIVKLFGFEIRRQDNGFAEDFIRYVQMLVRYVGVALIVVSDIHNFFSKEELDLIFNTLLLNEVYILCIESVQPEAPSQYEKLHVVDCELCEFE